MRFQIKSKGGRIELTDTGSDNASMTVVQTERLARALLAEAKRVKRAHKQLRRLLPIRALGGK